MRRILEEMVPELEDLETKGYFSRTEIRHIIQKRQDFEYNLQRRAALKGDFVRSIDYEKSLEKLRVLRKKQRHIQGKSTDHSIVRRTHKLYERMLKKFKGDLSLWNDWIQFCAVTKSSRQMSSVLTRVMQLFPNSAAVWTFAAAWELEHNNNATTARSLMQTGIRMCKDNVSLWVEYFRMELLYAARLGARRKILGVEQSSDDATKALLSGGVAKVVYLNAVKSIPESSQFRIKCLSVLRPVPIANKEDLEDFIIQNTLENCSDDDDGVWQAIPLYLFERACSTGLSLEDAVHAAIQVFNRKLCTTMVQAKMELLENFFSQASQCENTVAMNVILRECILTGEDALKKKMTNSNILLCLSRAYQRVGRYQDAITSLDQGASTSLIDMEKICLKSFDNSINGSHDILQSFLQVDADSRTENVWLVILSLCTSSASAIVSLAAQFEKDQLALVTQPPESKRGLIAACIMDAMYLQVGIEKAREFYNTILKCPLPGVRFIIEIGRLEQSLLSSHAPDALRLDLVRQVYNSGVAVYGSSSVDLWIEYYSFELSLGKKGAPGMVHWKARESLEDPDAFVIKSNFASQSADLEVW